MRYITLITTCLLTELKYFDQIILIFTVNSIGYSLLFEFIVRVRCVWWLNNHEQTSTWFPISQKSLLNIWLCTNKRRGTSLAWSIQSTKEALLLTRHTTHCWNPIRYLLNYIHLCTHTYNQTIEYCAHTYVYTLNTTREYTCSKSKKEI